MTSLLDHSSSGLNEASVNTIEVDNSSSFINPRSTSSILSDEKLLLANATALEQEMEWFSKIVETRLALYFENTCRYHAIEDIPPPNIQQSDSTYATIVNQYNMSASERLLLILTVIPHVKPQLLNLFFIKDKSIDKPFVEFGGWRGCSHNGFLPTVETAVFIIAGNDLFKRIQVLSFFKNEHYLIRNGIIDIQTGTYEESYLTAPLVLSREYFYRLTMGLAEKPDFSVNFPAKLIETSLDWSDLVLPHKVVDELEHIQTWLCHQQYIMHGMGLDKSIKPGYRALFYGPPGTGKTLTASLLGKSTGLDVYRIDLSSVVSKYIGETEKNLEAVFKQAENRQWILFFDEADALFGKRTETSSSNDRHANQEVAYLLQRIETFPGMVILASNLKNNIDDAFMRRFQSVIFFPMPDSEQRLNLWQKALNNSDAIDKNVNIKTIAKEHELAGGSIVNIVRYAATAALKNRRQKIQQQDFEQGINKELRKQGRII